MYNNHKLNPLVVKTCLVICPIMWVQACHHHLQHLQCPVLLLLRLSKIFQPMVQ